MANVSTKAMNDAASSISSFISNAQADIDNLNSNIDSINAAIDELESYNNQRTDDEPIVDYEYGNAHNNTKAILKCTAMYKWDIDIPEEISNVCQDISSKISDVCEILGKINDNAKEIDNSGDIIEAYINDINYKLGDDIDPSKLEKAFGKGKKKNSLKMHIAYSAEQAESGDFISDDKILTQYWVDKPLNFKKQENGTYAILQEDDNGNEVYMGFTDATTALVYAMSLGKATGFQKSNDSSSSTSSSSSSTSSSTSSTNDYGSGGHVNPIGDTKGLWDKKNSDEEINLNDVENNQEQVNDVENNQEQVNDVENNQEQVNDVENDQEQVNDVENDQEQVNDVENNQEQVNDVENNQEQVNDVENNQEQVNDVEDEKSKSLLDEIDNGEKSKSLLDEIENDS